MHDNQSLLRQLICDDPAVELILDRAQAAGVSAVLMAGVLFGEDPDHVPPADTRCERQLAALIGAYLDGERDLLDALARDHLDDYPDSALAVWLTEHDHRRAASLT